MRAGATTYWEKVYNFFSEKKNLNSLIIVKNFSKRRCQTNGLYSRKNDKICHKSGNFKESYCLILCDQVGEILYFKIRNCKKKG